MVRTAAVVAHFDPDNQIDPTFRALLEDLQSMCDLVILVSTSQLQPRDVPSGPNIVTLCRPNVGYDFYSYRVGITELLQRCTPERMLLVNSSFLISRNETFRSTLNEMLNGLELAEIVGATESHQWQWHLQSYLIAFRGALLQSAWFQSWLNGIAPRDSKIETILAGEFGLSAAIQAQNLNVHVMFQPSRTSKLCAMMDWAIKSLSPRTVHKVVKPSFWRTLPQFNPTHFLAHELAKKLGLIKTELIRSNPHKLRLGWLRKVCGDVEYAQIKEYLRRSGEHYHSTPGSMTALVGKNLPWPSIRLIKSGPQRQTGVRIAVVVHLFYPELASEIYSLLRNIVEPFDLIITTPREGATVELMDMFAPIASSVTIALSENRGRDVGPFIAAHRAGLFEQYEAVLKLHSKRSSYSEQGQFWQQNLFHQLCGNSFTVMRTLDLLRTGRVGLVGPHDYYLTHPHYWGANRATVRHLMQSLFPDPLLEEDLPLGFFAGTMFWFNPEALEPLNQIPDALLEFEPEAGQQDGTLAHALERLFSLLARQAGFTVTSLRLNGQDMQSISTFDHTVPVLKAPPAHTVA